MSPVMSARLADLAAVAGDHYNYGIKTLTPVNLFIDEAAEVLNQPAIQLMNKGGGADFRVTIATQTFADFASRLGDENKARQVLANTNNKIALRVLDSETQKYIAEGMPQIKVRSMALRKRPAVPRRQETGESVMGSGEAAAVNRCCG